MSAPSEKLEGNQIYTAGATMRVLGQQFTSTDQGENDIVYNDEITKWSDVNGTEKFTMPFKSRGKKMDRKKNVKV